MNNLDKQYTDLLQDILDNGVTKQDRTGTGTLSVFGRTIRHDMKTGFPILTTKKIPFRLVVTELLWFLRGDTNIKYLIDNNCHIWDGDCYKFYLNNFEPEKLPNYVDVNPQSLLPLSMEDFIDEIKTDDEFANKFGELGPIYGKQWRSWEGHKHGMVLGAGLSKEQPIDQIANLINDLKTNPDSRRLLVTAWNPEQLDEMVLPPCHYGFQVYTRELSRKERSEYYYKHGNSEGIVEGSLERPIWEENNVAHKWYDDRNIPTRAISLMWSQRSADLFLGIPFNIASYGLLLEIIATSVNMVPDELIGNLGDVHLYSNHIEQAKEQIGRELTLDERFELWGNKENEYAMDEYNKLTSDSRKHIFLSDRHQGSVKERTREPHPLPKLVLNPIFLANLEHKGLDEAINGQVNFQLENYQSHPHIPAPLSN